MAPTRTTIRRRQKQHQRENEFLDSIFAYEVYGPPIKNRVKNRFKYPLKFIVQFRNESIIRGRKTPSPALPRLKIVLILFAFYNRGGNSPALLRHKFYKFANTLRMFLM